MDGLEQYVLRPGAPYLSPAFIIDTYPNLGPWGIPYHMQGLAVQTTTNMIITAPEPWRASAITHSTKTLSTKGQYVAGAAPTTGIYTGVEDSC